nr:uncharacterized protein LOC108069452 [Drosophila takahashii]
MAKKVNLPDNLQSRVFALGPAPPGFRPPKASAFATAESNLRRASRYLEDTNSRLEYLRGCLQKEKAPRKLATYREKTVLFAKEQVRARELITKYRLKLVHLQDAEIYKVTKHLEQMREILTAVNSRLADLRSKIVKETDPKVRKEDVTNSFQLVREQHKTKGLCERWQDRLDQLKKARIVRSDQLLQKPKNFQSPEEKSKPKEKPKTESQKLHEAMVLDASKPKEDKNNANQTGCKRCAFLTKMNKQGQEKLCRVCKKWADDKNKAKDKVNNINESTPNTVESNELEVPLPMDSSSEESTIKIEIEPVNSNEIEELKSIEKKAIEKAYFETGGGKIVSAKRFRAAQVPFETFSNDKVNKISQLLGPSVQSPVEPAKHNQSGLQTGATGVKRGQWSVTISKAGVNKAQLLRRVEQLNGQTEEQNPSKKRLPTTPGPRIPVVKVQKLIRIEKSPEQHEEPNSKRFRTAQVPNETISSDKVNTPPQLFPVIVAIKSEAVEAFEQEDNVTSKDSVDPKIVTSIQNTLKSIDSKNSALAYLKILQEYAMLNDNFRAIGLLTEVEKSIINPPQNEDFDL